ncbi:MAG: RNA polymerase sigma factor [Candidatus Kapaibacterium sp.]|jgi:RNA polymerase sigma-70 factor (ECF subfamily)
MTDNAKQQRFMALLKPVYPRLERFALTVTRNRDDAKDIVGETVLKAFEGFEMLRDDKAFLSYIFTICSRVAQSARYAKRTIASAEQVEELFRNYTSPETATDIALLYQAIDKLSPESKEAIMLSEISGLSHKEVQEIQGGSLSSIKVRIFRAKKMLAELLGVGLQQQSLISES